MTETVGLGLLGAGIFAREAHLPAIKALGLKVKLNAIYSRSAKSAEALAQTAQSELALSNGSIAVYSDDSEGSGLSELLKRPDIQAVIIALPIKTQPSVVLQSLKAGKHVLSEKPIADTVAEAKSLIETYKSSYSSLHWRNAENFEAEPAIRRAGSAVRAGSIGDISFFSLSTVLFVDAETNKYINTPWRAKPEHQGGFLLDAGVHFAAILRTVLPQRATSLAAFSSLNRSHLPPSDTIHAIVQLAPAGPGGQPAHGIFELSFGAPGKSRALSTPNNLIVTGTKGWLSIAIDISADGIVLKVETHRQGEDGGPESVEKFEEQAKGVERELEQFVNLLQGKDAGYGRLEGALADVAFIESALQSSGKQVPL